MRTISTILFILVLALAISLAATLGVVGVGWVAVQVFPGLSLFEASLIALAISVGLLLVVFRLLGFPVPGQIFWEEDDWEEEDEPPVTPWRRSKPKDRASSGKGRRSSQKQKRR